MHTPTLNYAEFSGTPYHLGVAMGRHTASIVHEYLLHTAYWETLMQWRGTAELQGLLELVQQQHPYIHDELQGLARGLELPFEDVFLWNCRGDFDMPPPDSSTTLMIPDEAGQRLVHSAGGPSGFLGHATLSECHPDNGPAFISLVYPGSLAGHSVSVTANGLAVVIDSMQSANINPGLPRLVLSRALLNMTDMSSCVTFLNEASRAGSFHTALVQRGKGRTLSIECSHEHVSVQAIKSETEHANHAIHPETTKPDVAHAGKPEQDNNLHTLATVDITAGPEQVDWAVYEQPDAAARFKLIDASHI